MSAVSALKRALLWMSVRLSDALSGCLFLMINLPARFGSYRRIVNIAYGPTVQQRLDVYFPAAPSSAPRALIVFFHGGRWSFGDKRDYRFVGAALAALNCVAVVPNYRHYPEVKMPGFMSDAARAAGWALAHAADYGADALRVYLMGHSAGAHLAAMLALDRRYLAAAGAPTLRLAGVIGLSGPYDFLPLREADVQDMFGPEEKYPESQPINFVSGAAPPMLLIHGLRDETVRPKNARNLAAALCAHAVPVTLKLYQRMAHAGTVAALSPLARAPAIGAEIAEFLRARLKSERDQKSFLSAP
jgi:acetyl esterase/lipase